MEMIKERRETNPQGATSLPERGITKEEMEFICRERQINAAAGIADDRDGKKGFVGKCFGV